MGVDGGGSGRSARTIGPALAVALLVSLTLVAFAVARSQRSRPDIVNTVEVRSAVLPDGVATIGFDLTRSDLRADVLVIENEGTDQVRALQLGEPLEAGRQSFEWDLRADDGDLVEEGDYAIEVILGEQGRDIRPPERIEVREDG